MSKTNFFLKYLKNISNFINSLLEKNLNKLNFKNLSFLIKNNRIILTFVALFVIFVSYLLLPSFYSQSEISKELKNQIDSKLGINLEFSKNIKYNIFPRPHFSSNELNIFDDLNKISKINKLKVYISLDNFFSLKNIKIKDIIFEKANFNLNHKNYNFFTQLLSKNFKDGDLIIKKSNIFFRNSENEVLFINKILRIKYYYEPKEIKNILYSENKVFNIPFTVEAFFDEDRKKIFSNINLSMIKLKIENELTYVNKTKIGKSEIIFNKLKRIAEYKIEEDFLNLKIFDKKDEPNIFYEARINLKPFYASLEADLNEVNLNYIFGPNAVIAQLLKTEIFNNKNIDFIMNMNAKSIYKNVSFKKIKLKSKIKDGLIDLDNSKFEWKNFVNFELFESLIFIRDGELVLDGKLKIYINNYNEVYKFLLTPKNYRKKIKEIDLNFTYNFDQNLAILKDIKIDNEINQNVNKILNNVILKSDKFQNKIYLKNLLNEAIRGYAG